MMSIMPILYRAPDGTSFDSRQALDEQYDLALTLHEHSEHGDVNVYLGSFAERSVRARAELECELGTPYGPTLSETLDVFPGAAGGPIVVFVHGGSWMALTSAEHSHLAPGLVAHGATVIIPTYALCPAVTIDEIVRQVRAAIAWSYRNGERYGADPARIAVVGHSAGGHLATRLLDTDWEGEYGIPSTVISGACAISAIFDLRPIPFTSDQMVLGLTAEQVLRNSPILNLPVSAPPLLITYGTRQPREYHRQSVDFFRAWTAAGLAATCWERKGVNHFDELDALSEPDSELTGRVLLLSDGKLFDDHDGAGVA
jgi:arylformamidase